VPARIAFSTLAFPDTALAAAAALGRRWGYTGIELRVETHNAFSASSVMASMLALSAGHAGSAGSCSSSPPAWSAASGLAVMLSRYSPHLSLPYSRIQAISASRPG
jgi:sugar phosphate isomerase/epimerase